MGSVFWRITVPSAFVPEQATRLDWNRMGKRVMVTVERIVSWMSPSSRHERYSDASDETVKTAARLLGMRIRGRRGSR